MISTYRKLRKYMSKKTALLILLTIFFSALLAIAQPVTKVRALSNTAVDRMQNRATAAADKQSAELTRIQKRADTMIRVRLDSLQKLQTRIQNDKRLTADEKTVFTSDINTITSQLTTLKAKIDADTDAATALSDAKSIVTSYRIYEVFEPKIRLTLIIDNLQTTTNQLASLMPKIQTLLNTLKSQGKDITAAQTALVDSTTQLTAINTILVTDKSLLDGVSVGSSNPASVFVEIRKNLATVRADLAKIRSDFATIRTNLQIILPKGIVTAKPTQSTESAK